MERLIHTPEGVRDIYNGEFEKKRYLSEKINRVFSAYGYQNIETPSLEYFEVFSKQLGTVPARELYKFFDREGNTLVLRPDFTPSIARAASMYFNDEKAPVRLCYCGNTFINHSSYQGRLKEATQMGVELLGDNSIDADAEILAMVVELMLASGLKEFQISVGSVEFFRTLLAEARMCPEVVQELQKLISEKNHFGVEELIEKQKLPHELEHILKKIPQLFGGYEVLETALSLTGSPRAAKCLQRLTRIYEVMRYYSYEKYISFDLGMLTRYQYYTGIIFQAYTYGTGEPLVKGGRYDNLLGYFGKPSPAVGFGVSMDQLLNALYRQNISIFIPKETTLILYPEFMRREAILLSAEHRRSGMEVACQVMKPEDTLADYIAYGKKNRFGGIVYLKSSQTVQAINLSTEQVQNIDFAALFPGV